MYNTKPQQTIVEVNNDHRDSPSLYNCHVDELVVAINILNLYVIYC